MKSIVIALFFVMIASGAVAQTIADIQMGLVPENTPVEILNAVVTGATSTGFFMAEAPYGLYNGIWVFTPNGNTTIAGDIVNVQGEYLEYYDLSEIDTASGTVEIVGNGPVPAPTVVAASYDTPIEPYESCLVTIPDNMTVTTAPDQYGE